MEYSEKVMEHFRSPQNAHRMAHADGEGNVGDPSCGDSLRMFIKVRNNVIQDVSYLVFGCCAAIATSSMTSVMAKGKTLEEALAITEENIIEAQDGLPDEKKHCSNLGVGALRSAIQNYKEREPKSKMELMRMDMTKKVSLIGDKIVDHMVYRLFKR